MLTETEIELGTAIDRTLQYYAFFQYPLQVREIRRYCNMVCSNEDVLYYLKELELRGQVYCLNGYYSLLPDIATLLERRIRGKAKALRDLQTARRVGKLIYQFPFVSFVGISGSLSKGYSDHKSDFDFFIITSKDRLWISRTLLHILKKLTFVIGQQHKFCMNYFIDESALTLQEKNIYTATELSSLLPVCGTEMHERLMSANSWVGNMLPNYDFRQSERVSNNGSLLKSLASGVMNVLQPRSVNKLLMEMTDNKWQKKWARKGYPIEDYDLAFKTRINISKNHKANYQKRLLEALRPKE